MQWILKEIDEDVVEAVASISSLPRPLARVLALRGLQEPNAIEAFLAPRLAQLLDPFLLPNMERAVGRIWQALDAGEYVSVFGDYDVDGITSCALLTRVLTQLGGRVQTFIPNRLDEGYGLSPEAFERCRKTQTPSLLITVDCGTNSVESIARAQADGLDVIVIDHHEPAETTASPYALVNPKLDATCGLGGLAGVGVVFKTVHALLKSGRDAGRPEARKIDLRHFLDLVALGTVADLVPLVGDNRILVHHGLAIFKTTRWAGLQALKEVAGLRDEMDTYHLGFQLGPRINAVGRIGEPMQALKLLLTDELAEARTIAKVLDEMNRDRRQLEADVAHAASEWIKVEFDPSQHFGLTVAGQGWHPGVVGIVASRLARRYHRPVVVLNLGKDGFGRGSCRSIEAFDLLAGLQACDAHLIKYGGHRMAAGITLKATGVDAFRVAFNDAVRSALSPEDLVPVMELDAVLPVELLDADFILSLQQLGPFGQEHPEPLWLLPGVQVVGTPRRVGDKHLKFTVEADGRRLDAIAFNYSKPLPAGVLDLACTVKENRWGGQVSLQLHVRAARPVLTH